MRDVLNCNGGKVNNQIDFGFAIGQLIQPVSHTRIFTGTIKGVLIQTLDKGRIILSTWVDGRVFSGIGKEGRNLFQGGTAFYRIESVIQPISICITPKCRVIQGGNLTFNRILGKDQRIAAIQLNVLDFGNIGGFVRRHVLNNGMTILRRHLVVACIACQFDHGIVTAATRNGRIAQTGNNRIHASASCNRAITATQNDLGVSGIGNDNFIIAGATHHHPVNMALIA